MKKIVMEGPKKSKVIEVPDVSITEDQILVQLKYVGVCVSEHYDWSVAREGQAFGHEPMGIVKEVGKNVTDFKVGDRVSGLWGNTLPGGGGMVEYAAVDPIQDVVVKLPDNIRDVDAILEPLACLMSAVSKVRLDMPGTAVAVVGCGYMGCGAISLLKMKGAYVVAMDIRKESLEDAMKYGADEVYLVDEFKEKFAPNGFWDFKGYDVVMEWGETNESLDLAINITASCGQLCIGAYHTGGKRLVDVQQLNLKAIDCLSTHPREMNLSREGAILATKLLGSGAWDFINVPVKIYPMNGFDQAQEELETKYGKYMKAVIDMTSLDGEPYII